MNRMIVISDLHVADASPAYAIFHAEAPLIALIDSLEDGSTLVILGDALDYLQIAPFLAFTREAAVTKTEAIVSKYPELFAALARFLDRTDTRLRWVVGNHDIELLFPDVRAVLEREMKVAPGNVSVAGDGRPDGRLCWVLAHEAIVVNTGQGAIRLVHGNAHDEWNDVNYAHARKCAESGGDEKFVYAPGSILVAKVLNPLKKRGFRHLDLLKPEVTVAVPLALALEPDLAREYLSDAYGAFKGFAKSSLRTAISTALGQRQNHFGEGSAPPTATNGATLVARALAGSLATDAAVSADDLLGWFTEDAPRRPLVDAALAASGPPQFGTAAGVVKWLLRNAAARANGRSTAFDLHAPDEVATHTRDSLARHQAALLVAGHTHLARAFLYPQGGYINTGTWADLMHLSPWLSDQDFVAYANNLRKIVDGIGPKFHQPFQRLTYADIRLGHETFEAGLWQWQGVDGVLVQAVL